MPIIVSMWFGSVYYFLRMTVMTQTEFNFVDEVEYTVVRESDDTRLNVVGFKAAKTECYMLAVNSPRLYDVVAVYETDGSVRLTSPIHTILRDGFDIVHN
jgi:hypothetical protein